VTRKHATRVRYDKLVPEGTFLGDYLALMDSYETPHAYDFWTGCFAISSVVGLTTRVGRPGAPVHLNLFSVLVAESGTTRKSTAVRAVVKTIRPFTGEVPLLIESKITPEKLEQDLATMTKRHDTAQAVICISELVTFLGREKYVEQMPTLLTDLYDCPVDRGGGGSITAGARQLRNVFVSFLSASTPSWLLRAVNPDVIEGGFTSRVLFIVAEKPKRSQPWPEEPSDELRDRVGLHLERIQAAAKATPVISISDGGREAFSKWYKSRTHHRDPFRSSFQSREDGHILRLAAFLCINDGTWVIQHNHIVAATRIIEQVREDGASIFEGTGSNSRVVIGIDKIRDKLLAAGLNGLPQKDLTKHTAAYMKADVMRAVLDIMHDLGMVQRFDEIQVGRGRPFTLWRATAALAQSRALDKIIEKQAPEAR
jgi:hypothetical protein